MAVTVGELIAVLGANTRAFDSAMKRASDRIQKLGNTFSNIGGQLTRTVTLPLAAIGVAAIKATADWETAMVNVAKTVDAPASAIKALGRRFVALSEAIPQSAVALAEVGAAAGQLGIQTKNIFAFTKTMAALGVATNMSAVEAASSLARLAVITALPQDQFDRLGATVVALGNNLATTEREIVEMSLRIAGAGSAVGITQAKILGLAGALSSMGIRAEAGGTAISRVMIDIGSAVESGGGKLEDFARVAGLSVADFSRLFRRDAAGAIVLFIEGLGKLDQKGESLFGTLEALGLADIRVRDALLRAAGAGDLMRRSLELGTTAFEENTALTDEASKFYDRLAGRLVTLKNKLFNVAAEFGEVLRPAIDAAIDAVSRALDVIRNLVTAFGNLSAKTRIQIAAIVALVAIIGPLVLVLGAVFTIFGSVLSAISGVAIVLAILGVIIIAIKKNWFGMGDVAIKVWDGILSVIETVVTTAGPLVRAWINFMVGLFVGLGRAVAVVGSEMATTIKEAFEKMEAPAVRFLSGMVRGFARFGRFVSGVAQKMIDDFQHIFEVGKPDIVPMAEGLEAAAEGLGSRVANAFLGAFERDYVGAFFEIVRVGVERARELIASVLARLRGLLSTSAQDIKTLEDAIAELGEIVPPEVDGIPEGFGEAINAAQRFADIIGGEVANSFDQVLQGVRSIGAAVVSLGKAIFTSIVSMLVRAVVQALVLKAIMSAFGLGGGGGFGGILKGILGFQHGGLVPGRGPVPAILHGGEFVMNKSMLADLAQTSMGFGGGPAMQTAQAGAGAGPMLNVNVDFSRMPAPITPREAALNAAWQDLLRETFMQLEQGGFRIA